jgi:hypothetical protein
VITYQCLTNRLPFYNECVLTTIDLIRKAEADFNNEIFHNKKLTKDLISKILKNKEERINIETCMKHPAFSLINK